ncbi:hypothetical protein, partial [Maribacter sp. 2307ULW6-5]|uniref:hypothetical protein n=1 Tax=Maribacter sp. 2307ULW6-5 TaxID=3386275 RepID=UPI0039BC9885
SDPKGMKFLRRPLRRSGPRTRSPERAFFNSKLLRLSVESKGEEARRFLEKELIPELLELIEYAKRSKMTLNEFFRNI